MDGGNWTSKKNIFFFKKKALINFFIADCIRCETVLNQPFRVFAICCAKTLPPEDALPKNDTKLKSN